MRRYHLLPSALAGAVCLAAIGCGNKLVKITGKLTLDGQPVEGAVVVYERESGGGNPAAGPTDKDGLFQLGTFEPGDGALPGKYKVLILPPQATPREKPQPGMSMEQTMAIYARFKEQQRKNPERPFGSDIPAMYRDPSQTPLRQLVPPTGPVTIDLQADASAKNRPTRPKGEATDPMAPPKPAQRR
jgi:hypothetical protein